MNTINVHTTILIIVTPMFVADNQPREPEPRTIRSSWLLAPLPFNKPSGSRQVPPYTGGSGGAKTLPVFKPHRSSTFNKLSFAY
ncbi:hypothetical protein RRG08_060470 [Elysia crispata]|uniref:Uncharacterized protein n=1 Tax=Elysia crispata TaxID=231223 RepID=A0AAE1B1H0_9GAST|nr:hypothetical protein RRG08_060470 [Elysia crispata]